jgi:hypothetical protein
MREMKHQCIMLVAKVDTPVCRFERLCVDCLSLWEAHRASLIATGAYFAFVLALVAFKPKLTDGQAGIAVVATLSLSVGIACWWMFRKLQTHLPRAEARAATIAFAVVSPVAMAMALLLGQFGGYASVFFGDALAFPGTLAGALIIFSVVSFMGVAFKLWTMRREAANGGSPLP